MRVLNGDVSKGELYRYLCDCGARLDYEQEVCNSCGAKINWANIDKLEEKLNEKHNYLIDTSDLKGVSSNEL